MLQRKIGWGVFDSVESKPHIPGEFGIVRSDFAAYKIDEVCFPLARF